MTKLQRIACLVQMELTFLETTVLLTFKIVKNMKDALNVPSVNLDLNLFKLRLRILKLIGANPRPY